MVPDGVRQVSVKARACVALLGEGTRDSVAYGLVALLCEAPQVTLPLTADEVGALGWGGTQQAPAAPQGAPTPNLMVFPSPGLKLPAGSEGLHDVGPAAT